MRFTHDPTWRVYDPVEEPLTVHWEAIVGKADLPTGQSTAERGKGSRPPPLLRTDKRGRVVGQWSPDRREQ